jgi:integrase
MASDSRVKTDTYADGRKRYTIRWREVDGKHIKATFSTYTEAKAKLLEVDSAKASGSYVPRAAGRVKLQQLYDDLHATRSYAPATLRLHAELWKKIGPKLGSRAINTMSSDTVARELSKMFEAPVMREKARLLLSTLFASSSLTVNPAKKPRRASTRAERQQTTNGTKDTKRYLDAKELARLLAEIPERYRTLVHLMARVGLRPGEAYALKVGKFDPWKRTLRIDTAASGDTKTGESRTVVLPAIVAEELSAHIERWSEWAPDALIFPGERGAMIIGGNFRRREFAPAAERAGVAEGFRVNDLRHSAVSFAIAHGATVYSVQQMVGHAKPSITLDVYGELWDESQEVLADKLDAAIRAEDVAVAEGVVVPMGGRTDG